MKRSFIDRFIHSITEKPKHCVKVKNPPRTVLEKLRRPQDARQEQYNRWSRHFKVYSGSYLPKNPDDLLSKGWKQKNISEDQHKYYQRKAPIRQYDLIMTVLIKGVNLKAPIIIGIFGGKIILAKKQKNDLEKNNAKNEKKKKSIIMNMVKKHALQTEITIFTHKEYICLLRINYLPPCPILIMTAH